ncbi:alkaline-phosphatase-like protein [Cokeromyces recurvatus]|uniref:alkaline-phosphatase-like protein n=1 Tax=Cokeromyces recurvatus TaxID=90255 RepID=UPI0022203327|nr:alkaline-phosphatase-like protein [Cokeromyces recurvatus]KAI7903705.1 alkaline-phosphatase-like protein [Cokeromyces recurvatus]
MISDGFGPASETFARQYHTWKENLIHKSVFPLDKIIVGQSRTLSSSSLITDSAAGATAFSCALKTYNGAIGVYPDKKPCGTVLESAKIHRKMKTGLVVKSRITHATPAAFSAHINWRDWENDIAVHQVGYTPLGRTVDLMFGGGLCEFLSNTTEGSCRLDNRDLITEAKNDFDWDLITTKGEFNALDEKNVKLPLMGLFAPHHIAYAIDNDPSLQPSLVEMTEKALSILKESTKDSSEGFFLMIEGSRIDMAAHNNDAAAHFLEILEYQKTIEKVMKFVDENPGTILISTSDHETGGLTVGRQVTNSYPEYEWKPEVIAGAKNSTEILSWEWAKAIKEGRDTKEFLVETLIKKGLGVEDVTDEELDRLLAWKSNGQDIGFFASALSDLVSKRAQIGWTTMGHTAVDVNLYAYGYQSELLRGNHENTDIGDFIVDYLNLDLNDITKRLNSDQLFQKNLKGANEELRYKKSNHELRVKYN